MKPSGQCDPDSGAGGLTNLDWVERPLPIWTTPDMDYSQLAEFANLGLSWIGFGAVAGLIAKAIMPGHDRGDTLPFMIMGIVGALVGCALARYFSPGHPIEPVSFYGFTLGSGSALLVLSLYRILSRQIAHEAHDARRRRRRRRQRLYDFQQE